MTQTPKTQSEPHPETAPIDIDPPPFFRHWRSMYILVLVNLAVLILLFHLLTISCS